MDNLFEAIGAFMTLIFMLLIQLAIWVAIGACIATGFKMVTGG